jgi:hypothetical protein
VLGPALTQLLHDLAAIEVDARTSAQRDLFKELALLAAASRPDEDDEQFTALRREIASRLKIDDFVPFSITRPDPDRATGVKVCTCCGQRIR